jgi:4-amino-4-deoxy-L-arabinose transferase-like glycosyltransferase
MDTLLSRTSHFPRSISNTFQYLFIAERDLPSVYWILGIITLLGMILRLWKINEPIAYDEAYTFIYYAARPFKQILSDYSAPNNHILHTILVRISYQIFGGHPWIVRLPAFLAGTLCIPAGYFAARRIFNSNQSLAAAALVALTPWFISYSTNGRGYTLLTLLALLLTNFAGLLVQQQSRSALIAYGITAALGFYTIPIFLYPMAGISLWVLVTYLAGNEPWKIKSKKIWTFLAVCALAGILTLLLYSPVFLFGTGAGSIMSNEFVEPSNWYTFQENIGRRTLKTWEDWMLNIAPIFQYTLLSGFLLSLFFYKRVSKQKLPLQLFMMLAIIILLVLQRVAPFPRMWIFLEIFFMVFAGAGLVWLIETLTAQVASAGKMIPVVILFIVFTVFTAKYFNARQASITASNDFPEQHAAEYLASHLKNADFIFSIAPVDMQLAYYLYMNSIPYSVFYQRDHPSQVENALIVLRKNTKYNTPQRVLEFYNSTSHFDLGSAVLVYEYGPLNIFSVPSNP